MEINNYDYNSENFLELHNEVTKIDKRKIISLKIEKENSLNTFTINFNVNKQDLRERLNETNINKFNSLNFCLKYLKEIYPLFCKHIYQNIKNINRITLFNMYYIKDFNYEITLIIKEF